MDVVYASVLFGLTAVWICVSKLSVSDHSVQLFFFNFYI